MSLNLRLLAPAVLLILACTPKDDNADDGDSTAAEEGTNGASTTSGDQVTTGDSDPTNPGTATNVSSGGTPGTASDTTPSTTTAPGTASDTESSDEVTSVGTASSVGTTVDPSDSDSDTDTTGPDVPPVACEGEPVPIEATTIMAYNESQVPQEPDPTLSGTGGDPNPPDTLYIKFSDVQFSCEAPNANLECGPHWELTLVILPEFQFPGLYNLGGGNGPFATVFETAMAEGMGNDCAGGGGGGFDGTFELINITDTTVEGRLCGLDAFFSFNDPNLDGSFVAERCK